jgi:hypothetical protein
VIFLLEKRITDCYRLRKQKIQLLVNVKN